MNESDFNHVIRKRRKEAGLTQAQLAKLLDVTTATVSRWERASDPPSHRNRRALARELGGKTSDYA